MNADDSLPDGAIADGTTPDEATPNETITDGPLVDAPIAEESVADGAVPDRQNWANVPEAGWDAAEFGTFTTPLIEKSDTVVAVGTMLAARLMTAMRSKRFSIVRVDPPHPAFADIAPETEEYLSFSAGYGEVWSARELRQLIRRVDRSFTPQEDRRHDGDVVIDPYRPRLLYPARTDQEFDLLRDRHLNAVRSAFRRCSTLIVALGASEICEAIADGAVIPARSGAASRGFDAERYVFRTLTVAETIDDLTDAIAGLRALNPGMKIILMISPEPLAATATHAHVVSASAHGKAILRVAMEELAGRPGISFFPALEIVAPLGITAFGADGRSLSTKAIKLIGAALAEACEGGAFEMVAPDRPEPEEPATTDEADTITADSAEQASAAARERRIAARAAKAQAEAEAAASPSPKRAVATVVGEYAGTEPTKKAKKPRGLPGDPPKPKVPKQRRDASESDGPATAGPTIGPVAKKEAASVAEPKPESKKLRERRERWERRTARETKRATARAEKQSEGTPITEAKPAVSRVRKARTDEAASTGDEAKVPATRARRKPKSAVEETTSVDPAATNEPPKRMQAERQEERKRRRLATKAEGGSA